MKIPVKKWRQKQLPLSRPSCNVDKHLDIMFYTNDIAQQLFAVFRIAGVLPCFYYEVCRTSPICQFRENYEKLMGYTALFGVYKLLV